jgi:hypothetical protein
MECISNFHLLYISIVHVMQLNVNLLFETLTISQKEPMNVLNYDFFYFEKD